MTVFKPSHNDEYREATKRMGTCLYSKTQVCKGRCKRARSITQYKAGSDVCLQCLRYL